MTSATMPTCSAGEFIRFSHGDFSCAILPVTTQPPIQFCATTEAYGALILILFILLGGLLIYLVKANRRRHKQDIFHEVCRRTHNLSEPCLFTDEQKKLIAVNGTPIAYEHSIMKLTGTKIPPQDAIEAIGLYREKWDAAGRR